MAWIDLEGAVNVRDLGGLPWTHCAHGTDPAHRADDADSGTTVPGRLLRSENLQELTPGDITRLVDEIGVTTVVDLRTTAEVELEGPGPLDTVPGVRHAYHPVLPELGSRTDAVAEALLLRKAEQDRSRFPDDIMCGHYLGYLEERPDEVTGALRSIATADGAAIVHCAAGKDRTGVIVALALTVAGVERAAIVADYMATGDRIDAIIERLSRSKTYADDVSSRPVRAHMPREETMKAFLEQLHARYGGLSAWLAGHGFGDDEAETLRAKLVRA